MTGHTEDRLKDLFNDVLKLAGEYEKDYSTHIPVIPAGGIFDGKDMARFLKMGKRTVLPTGWYRAKGYSSTAATGA